jgi:regulator of protease activity HflC (stomatin/prohibitin superfamily)
LEDRLPIKEGVDHHHNDGNDDDNGKQSAQKAADQYLGEIKAIRDEAEARKEKILSDARARAAEIIAEAERQCDYSLIVEAMLDEYGQNPSKDGD